ncbi:MAG: TetR/AcrR family transcriptional regulator [Syntrophaceae bacterium]|nr:TetR/AcrR family transcriptional regulator [Syntrophaceae bacterium]
MEKPGETARKILIAARALFAEKGYSATHVDEIARHAGVNKATLYYQIGDKDTLYAKVIHQVIGNIAQNIAQAVAKESSPEEKLAAYINNMADAVDKNPEIPPIMMREIASGGMHLPLVVVEDMSSILIILIGILDEGKKKGVFAETVPFLIHTMIMGTILFYKGALPVKDRKLLLPADVKARDKKLKCTVGAEVSRLVLKAISV